MRTMLAAVLGTAVVFTASGCAVSSEEAGSENAGESSQAASTRAKLLCASTADALVYFGDESQILLTADVTVDKKLKDLSLSMRANDNLGVSSENLTAAATYRPRSATYRDHAKYSTADAWCGYSIIAPKLLASRTSSFPVYLQQACEGGFISTATLNCRVTTGRGGTTGGGTSAGEIVLKYSAARKREVIRGGYFEATDFTGNEIVANTSTNIDIMYLLPESDTSVPDELCYRGTVTDAKKVARAMLANTDGNGDHWLDSSAVTSARGNMNIRFTATGEGGPNDYELDIPVCR